MYRAVGIGAGPGEVATYQVDLPLPWGANTEVTLPMQALVDDAWTAMEPAAMRAVYKGAFIVSLAVAISVSAAAIWIKRA